ncbi:finTRIM family, member 86 isoform 2-T2 [Menidia menidia]
MASAWPEDDSFACSVCLDTLKDPTTLPCGHSYCLVCIQRHWDKGSAKGQYSCPQCRHVFNPRPSLAKSTVLADAVEKLRTNSLKKSASTVASSAPPSMPIYLEVLPHIGPRKGSVYPQLPSVEPRACPQHNQPLNLFCHEDKECVCEVCSQHGHRGHRVVIAQQERKARQTELVQMQAEIQRRIYETERKLRELPHAAQQHRAQVQAMEKESSDLFSELGKSLALTGTQVVGLLGSHETVLGSDVEGQIQGLQQEMAQLQRKSEEVSGLADIQDNVCFLKNFFLAEPLDQKSTTGESNVIQEEAMVASIRSTMKELQESIQDLCKASVAKIAKLVNLEVVGSTPNGVSADKDATLPEYCDQASGQSTVNEALMRTLSLPPPRPQAEPSGPRGTMSLRASAPPPPLPPPRPQASGTSTVGLVNPEPQTREEMLKFRFEPTMDPNTAHHHMLLSDDGLKATMRAENLNPPDHPDRFSYWRQVLCKESLAGSPYYWEVEWSGHKISIGVAQKEMERKSSDDKSRFGHNDLSWSLYWSGTGFTFWHDGQQKLLGSPKARRIGIYLDQQVGILSFHSISNNRATLIHRHQTQFTGPVYPGFRLGAAVGEKLTICQLD